MRLSNGLKRDEKLTLIREVAQQLGEPLFSMADVKVIVNQQIQRYQQQAERDAQAARDMREFSQLVRPK